ncbi:MAG: cytochrome c, partial [Pedosphaera sp.]|nr:cytochrome c [Pedosphaera sp.]
EVHKGLGGPIEKVFMDESYFIESVRKPMDKVVKGALAPMPPTVPINDEELMALLAYVKSLSKKEEE